MLEYRKRVTSQEDFSEDIRGIVNTLDKKVDYETLGGAVTALESVMESKVSTEELKESVSNMLRIANKLQHQVCGMSVCDISDSGYVDIKDVGSCPVYSGDFGVDISIDQPVEYQKKQVRLTLRSDYDALKRQVDSLKAQLDQLQVTTKITPITDSTIRCTYNQLLHQSGKTIHPKYGDWILTSDSTEQHISFSGLLAEIGKSIYIQTRRRAYLYANGHAFYGLPGDVSNGVRVDQWLSHNTTYRFVRASSDSWCVTSSSSPYPWT